MMYQSLSAVYINATDTRLVSVTTLFPLKYRRNYLGRRSRSYP